MDVLDDPLDGVELHVLRQDAEPAEARHRLGHALAGDGVHVRRDDRVRAPGKIGRREVGVEARGAVEVAGVEEDVVGRELELFVVGGMEVAQAGNVTQLAGV